MRNNVVVSIPVPWSKDHATITLPILGLVVITAAAAATSLLIYMINCFAT